MAGYEKIAVIKNSIQKTLYDGFKFNEKELGIMGFIIFVIVYYAIFFLLGSIGND